jgi:hypothetical protein
VSGAVIVTTPEELRALIRDEVRAALAPARAEPEPIYLRVPAYAERVAMGERTVWTLVRKGLPCIGVGRSRRVDVRAADTWLKGEQEHVDDAIERDARRAARARASRQT